MNIQLTPRKVTLFFAVIAVFLVFAHLLGLFSRLFLDHPWVFGLVPLFDLDREGNAPTYFESVGLLFCALLLGLIAFAYKREKTFLQWVILSVIFSFLSLDEAASIHETIAIAVRKVLKFIGMQRLGYVYFAWVIPYAILLLILAAFYYRFFFRLPRKTQVLFAIAGILFVSGAMGFELLGGKEFEQLEERKSLIYFSLTFVEELLEFGGMILFIYALMDYISAHIGEIRLRFNRT